MTKESHGRLLVQVWWVGYIYFVISLFLIYFFNPGKNMFTILKSIREINAKDN